MNAEDTDIDYPGESPERQFIYLFPSFWGQELLCAIGLLCLLFALRFQTLLNLDHAYLGGYEGDTGLYLWLSKSNLRDLFGAGWFNTKAFFPYGRTLAWSDNFILPAFSLWPLLKLGLPFVAAWNLLMLSVGFLNGYFTYRLCHRLAGKALPAFFGGAIFMSLSALSANLGHPQLQFLFWFPLAALFLFRALSRETLFDWVAAGLCVTGAFLTTVYYSIFLVLFVAALVIGCAASKPVYWKRFRPELMLGGLLIGAAPLVFFLPPYLDVRKTFGARFLYESFFFSADTFSYLSASPLNLLYGWTSVFSHDEAHLFGGAALLILLAVAFFRFADARPLRLPALGFAALLILTVVAVRRAVPGDQAAFPLLGALGTWLTPAVFLYLIYRLGRLERSLGFHIITNRGLLAAFLFTALLFVLLSFGPVGNIAANQPALSLFRPFYEWFPGFNSTRAIGRIGICALFCFCVASSLVLAHYQAQGRIGPALVGLLLFIALGENLHTTYALQPERSRSIVFDFLEGLKEKDALVVLPFTSAIDSKGKVQSWTNYAIYNVNYMNWAFSLDRPLVNGYSGQRSKLMLELPGKLRNFPDQESFDALSAIAGLKHVVFLSKQLPGFNQEEFEARIANFSPALKYIYGDRQEGVYLFEFKKISRLNEPGFFLLTPSYPGGTLTLDLVARRGGIPDDIQSVQLEVYRDRAGRLTPIGALTLPLDEISHTYRFHIPEAEDRVRPAKLVFKTKPDGPVYLIRSSYSAQE